MTAMMPSCKVNKTVFFAFLPNIAIIFYLFYDFYQKSYGSKKAITNTKAEAASNNVNNNNNNHKKVE